MLPGRVLSKHGCGRCGPWRRRSSREPSRGWGVGEPVGYLVVHVIIVQGSSIVHPIVKLCFKLCFKLCYRGYMSSSQPAIES